MNNNNYQYGGCKIELTKGLFALVDQEDFEFLNQWKWHAGKGGKYAARRPWNKGNPYAVYMHRLIMNPGDGMIVDHINGNGLDNRRANLRICTNADNQRNHKLLSTNKSGFNGVSWDNRINKWATCISVSNKTIHVGVYENIIDAAIAYNIAAQEYFGEFAKLNIIEG